MKKFNDKYIVSSFTAFTVFLIIWQVTGSAAEGTQGMDNLTSYAVLSFLGTSFF